jgi:hypothetical protein
MIRLFQSQDLLQKKKSLANMTQKKMSQNPKIATVTICCHTHLNIKINIKMLKTPLNQIRLKDLQSIIITMKNQVLASQPLFKESEMDKKTTKYS